MKQGAKKKYPKSLRKPDLFHWALSIPALRLQLLPPTLKRYMGELLPKNRGLTKVSRTVNNRKSADISLALRLHS